MAIEEKEEERNEEPKSNGIEESKNCRSQFQSKLNIENSICYCDRAPGPSQNVRPRPHFRTDYCLDDSKEKATIKNNNSKKTKSPKNSTPPLSNVNSVSQMQEQKSFPTFTKPKSIFSCAMPPKRTNSVIIEELPNEPRNSNSTDIKKKSDKKVANKDNSSAASVNNKNACDDKTTIKSNARNLNGLDKSGNTYEKVNVKLSPREIRIADKYENGSI